MTQTAQLRLIEKQVHSHRATNQSPFFKTLQKYVSEIFQRYYGADLTYFHQNFLYLLSSDQELAGAVGYTPAHLSSQLFLEQYLTMPVDKLLSQKQGCEIRRETIVEVGNLATNSRGTGRALFTDLAEQLYFDGYEWTVFTATRLVRNIFSHMCNCMIELEKIDNTKQEIPQGWGSYYDNTPVVMAVPVQDFYQTTRTYSKESA